VAIVFLPCKFLPNFWLFSLAWVSCFGRALAILCANDAATNIRDNILLAGMEPISSTEPALGFCDVWFYIYDYQMVHIVD